MRKVSSFLLPLLAKSKPKFNPKSHHRPHPPFIPKSRTLATANPTHQSDLEEAFESSTTTSTLLSSFSALQPTLRHNRPKLALSYLKLAQHFDSEPNLNPSQSLHFALQALAILEGSSSISLAMALHVAGSASYNLNKFNDSLAFLNRASRILSSIEKEPELNLDNFDYRPVRHAVELQLANTKTAMGRREEALRNLRKCLDIKVELLGEDSQEVGVVYRDLAEAYAAVLNFKEALPLCLKALEIHEGCFGENSVEVARDRRLLGVIYTGLDENVKALAENQVSQKVMKSWGEKGSDLLHAEIDAANIQISMGKFDEAVSTLKGVVQQTDNDNEMRALVFISMAKAMCNLEKTEDAKQCLEVARGIFEKKELESPSNVAEAYVEISTLYETMNEFETAISLLKKSLSMIERIPQEQHVEGNVSAKIGWLLLLTGKVSEAISYLESAAERMKESFGPKHFGVGYIYNNLGAAYMELERPQSAAQMFALAKDIMDVSLGPHHADSIEACQSLANAYSAMGSYPLALEFQQQVVNAWENHGPSAKDQLKEAVRLLELVKKKAFETLPQAASQVALPQN